MIMKRPKPAKRSRPPKQRQQRSRRFPLLAVLVGVLLLALRPAGAISSSGQTNRVQGGRAATL